MFIKGILKTTNFTGTGRCVIPAAILTKAGGSAAFAMEKEPSDSAAVAGTRGSSIETCIMGLGK